MARRPLDRFRRTSGFTLLEVIVAVVILALAGVILLGLQGSSTSATIRSRHKAQAIFSARQILAHYETLDTPPDAKFIEGTLSDVLQDVAKDTTGLEPAEAAKFLASVRVSDWPLLLLPPDALRRVTVTISWGQSASDSLIVDYFIPSQPD